MVEAQVAGLMKMPVGFVNICKFVHNTRQRGKALLGALVAALVA